MFRVLTLLGLSVTSGLYLSANTANPPLATTGAPGESTCAACHAGQAAPGAIVMEFGALAYTPGVKQTIRIHIWSSNFSYTGMEITARLASNELQQGGHFEAGAFTSVRTQNGIEYVSQNVAAGTTVYTIGWTPPANNAGSIRFYATGVTGIGNSQPEPNAYSASYTMPPSTRDVPSGFRWQPLSTPSNGVVTAISSDGRMTGIYPVTAQNVAGAFVRDTAGNVTSFGPSVLNDGILPKAVNSSGKVVGYYNDKSGATTVQRGFIRDANGTFTTFDVPGSQGTQLLSINDAGLITGAFQDAGLGSIAIQLTAPPSFSLVDPLGSLVRTVALNNVGNSLQVGTSLSEAVGVLKTGANTAGFGSCAFVSAIRGGSLDGSINDSLDFTAKCTAFTFASQFTNYFVGTAGSSRKIPLGAALSQGITNAGAFAVLQNGQQFLLSPCVAAPNPTFAIPTAPPAGGTISVSFNSSLSDCSANAVQESPWLHPRNSGEFGSVTIDVDSNQTGSSRMGSIWVAGSSIAVQQAAAPCNVTLSGAQATFPGAGGASLITVSNSTSCAWTASSDVDWITFTGASTGTGNGSVAFSVLQNNGTTARNGTITIGNAQLPITQTASATCSYTVTPTSLQVSSSGTAGSFTVTTGSTCPWSVFSPQSWIVFTGTTASLGNGTVSYAIAPNSLLAARAATLVIAGVNISVVQSGLTVSSGMRIAPMPPCRLLETRPLYASAAQTGVYGPPLLLAGTTRTIPVSGSAGCPIPPNAKVMVFNVTLIPRNGAPADFVTIYPAGENRPDFWSIRSPDGQIVANTAIVKVGAGNAVSIYTSDDADVLLDAFAYMTDDPAISNLAYYPVTPCRVVDTRVAYRSPAGPFGPPTMGQGETRRFRFPSSPYCAVPAGATAYSVTLTAVPPQPLAYITAWSAGLPQPIVSNMNSFAGRTLANNLVIPVSPDGSIDVFTYNASDILLDINGYFAPDNGAGLFYFPVTQCRAADTRSGGPFGGFPSPFGGPIMSSTETRVLPIPNSTTSCSGLPTNAKAWVVNATAIPNGSPMPFLTMWDTGGSQPNASQLNAFEGQTVTNTAIVPAGPSGSINAYTYRQTHLVLDISGYFGR